MTLHLEPDLEASDLPLVRTDDALTCLWPRCTIAQTSQYGRSCRTLDSEASGRRRTHSDGN